MCLLVDLLWNLIVLMLVVISDFCLFVAFIDCSVWCLWLFGLSWLVFNLCFGCLFYCLYIDLVCFVCLYDFRIKLIVGVVVDFCWLLVVVLLVVGFICGWLAICVLITYGFFVFCFGIGFCICWIILWWIVVFMVFLD